MLGDIIDGADVTSPVGLGGNVCEGNSSFDKHCDLLKPMPLHRMDHNEYFSDFIVHRKHSKNAMDTTWNLQSLHDISQSTVEHKHTRRSDDDQSAY
jgi:hypothetical protein